MTHSDSIAALAAALSKAQGEYPAIPRDKVVKIKTKAGGEYTFNYAPLDSILTALRPVLVANGLAVVQDIEGGAVSTMILHSSGEWWRGATVLIPSDEPGPKAVGSALTYAQRYSFRAAMNVVTDDDDDATTAAGDHMTVKAPERPQDAPTGSAAVRHPEPPKDGKGEGSSVNAALLRDKDPASVVGRVNSDITAKTIKVGEHNVDISEFNLIREDGVIHKVTAWDKARDVADALSMGEAVHVTGKWHVFKNIVAIDAREIVVLDPNSSLPF